MKTDEIIIQPIITEKSLKEAAKNRYTFLVVKQTRKASIKKAIKSLFDVDVKKVSISNMKKDRVVRSRVRRVEKSFDYKKVRVELGPGQKIALFEEIAKGNKND